MIAIKRYQFLCDILWVLFSLTICFASIPLTLGTPSDPGPGFLPFWTGVVLLLFSIVELVKDLQEGREAEPHAGPYWKRVITTLLSLFGYALILTRLGYLLTTFMLMFFLYWSPEYRMGNRRWEMVIVKAMFSAGITYLVFNKWLDCQLPRGLFGF